MGNGWKNVVIIRAIDCEGGKNFWKEYRGSKKKWKLFRCNRRIAFESPLSGEESQAENRMKVERGRVVPVV